jgi:hypothetical protein
VAEKPNLRAKPKLKQPTTPAQPQARMHRVLWRAVKAVFGFVVVLVGLIGGAYTMWGPPWPTEPSFVPGAPSFGSPLDVPFTVTNKSSVFSIKNLHISCHGYEIKVVPPNFGSPAPGGGTLGGWAIEGFTFSVPGNADLMPGETRPYTCVFNSVMRGVSNQTGYRIVEADIAFVSEYDARCPFPDAVCARLFPCATDLRCDRLGSGTKALSGHFTLNTKTDPLQWMPGKPL